MTLRLEKIAYQLREEALQHKHAATMLETEAQWIEAVISAAFEAEEGTPEKVKSLMKAVLKYDDDED